MSEVPRSWSTATLGDVVDVLDSRRIPVNAAERALRPGDVPYYGATGQVGSINEAIFDEELVLLGEDGAPFLDQSKPKAYLVDGPSWVNNHAHVLRAIPGVTTNRFLKYALDAADFRPHVNGTTRLKLTQKAMNSMPIPLPPRAEQERIVAAIEEHLSRLDAVSTGLAAVPDKLDRFRQVLLRDSFDASWERVPITAVTDPERVIRYGILKPGDDVTGGIPVVKVRDYPAGEIRVDSLKRTTPEIAARFAGATLRPGDVLISIRGTFGRVAPVPDSLDGASITQDSARISPLPTLHRGFLVHFLRSPECQHFLRRVARGVAVKGVNIRDLRMLNIPLPDFETQVATSDRLDDQLSLHRHLGAEVDRARRGIESLRRSILSAAFSGQLVPQDPDDEPASALLDRIRAEHAAATPTKRTRKAKAS